MRRDILFTLKNWKSEINRKVLLLRGARQVGKTYIVRELAKGFTHYVEVKSGSTGKMQSMYRFLEEKKAPWGLRLSLENFSAYDRIRVIPLYAVSNFAK